MLTIGTVVNVLSSDMRSIVASGVIVGTYGDVFTVQTENGIVMVNGDYIA